MPISYSFRRDDIVIPILSGGVVAIDDSSANARSGTGELTVHAVNGKGDRAILTLYGIDGRLHDYHAIYFRPRLEHES